MSKRDKLTFRVKQSLVVGTATAAIGAASCGQVISNPVPTPPDADDAQADVPDAGETGDASAGDAAGSDDTSGGAADATDADAE